MKIRLGKALSFYLLLSFSWPRIIKVQDETSRQLVHSSFVKVLAFPDEVSKTFYSKLLYFMKPKIFVALSNKSLIQDLIKVTWMPGSA